MTKKHLQRGFTLIELLVVIAIISLLASIILASISTARKYAVDARSAAEFERIKVGLQLYHNDHGGYPLCDTTTTSNESQTCCIGDSEPNTPGDQCYLARVLINGGLPELLGLNTQNDAQLAALAYTQKPFTGFAYVCPGDKIDRSGGATPICTNAYGSYFENGDEKFRWFGDGILVDPTTVDIVGDGSGTALDNGSGPYGSSPGPGDTDTDGDGNPDYDDVCPTSATDVCATTTDSDLDGQNDDVDSCPNQAAQTASGCPVDPDTDGDGIPDSIDSCPDTYAQTGNGCSDTSGSDNGSGAGTGSGATGSGS
jgi:prepilin-type N-terminal cleavage/methylation domain-containing protein